MPPFFIFNFLKIIPRSIGEAGLLNDRRRSRIKSFRPRIKHGVNSRFFRDDKWGARFFVFVICVS